MKKWLLGFALLTAISSLGACHRNNGCKGGGWYGNRNLSFAPKTSPTQNLDCAVEEQEIVADEQTAMPSR